MSRTALTALRKHATPVEFARRFLLPTVKRGKVPAVKNWPAQTAIPARINKPYDPIIFANQNDPSHVFFLNILLRGNAREPRMRLLHHTRGINISQEDWNAAHHAIGVEPNEEGELALRHEHINPKWEKRVEYFRGKKRIIYYLPPKLFEEIIQHAYADKTIQQFETALLLLNHEITATAFTRRTGIVSNKELVNQFINMVDEKKPFLRRLMSAPTPEKATEELVKKFGISKRFATLLGKRVIELKYNERMKTAWQEMLRKINAR
ncbi:MAG: hypothetical protein FJY86_01475 [Candidatus Diapherotrites archaeon]|uniref:Uncharacterized protein n=1 Tax=Candidatus Iainarchaeum sp. TaxID=3101447 RepID=A0A8T4C663_9ARCH|nr:hypothetical protein [Candidatus Diapherotrites archaeon]